MGTCEFPQLEETREFFCWLLFVESRIMMSLKATKRLREKAEVEGQRLRGNSPIPQPTVVANIRQSNDAYMGAIKSCQAIVARDGGECVVHRHLFVAFHYHHRSSLFGIIWPHCGSRLAPMLKTSLSVAKHSEVNLVSLSQLSVSLLEWAPLCPSFHVICQ